MFKFSIKFWHGRRDRNVSILGNAICDFGPYPIVVIIQLDHGKSRRESQNVHSEHHELDVESIALCLKAEFTNIVFRLKMKFIKMNSLKYTFKIY